MKSVYEAERDQLETYLERKMKGQAAELKADTAIMEKEFMRIVRQYDSLERRANRKDEAYP